MLGLQIVQQPCQCLREAALIMLAEHAKRASRATNAPAWASSEPMQQSSTGACTLQV